MEPLTSPFGDWIKSRRLARRTTLRAFALRINMDPSNYSRIERGLASPPADLGPIARELGLAPGSPETRELERLASISRNEIPAGVRDGLAGQGLPVLFRTLEETPLTEERFEELVEFLRRS